MVPSPYFRFIHILMLFQTLMSYNKIFFPDKIRCAQTSKKQDHTEREGLVLVKIYVETTSARSVLHNQLT